jgi:hypothetical protein
MERIRIVNFQRKRGPESRDESCRRVELIVRFAQAALIVDDIALFNYDADVEGL